MPASSSMARGFRADVASRADVDRVAAEITAEFGRVHVLVNNAGAGSVLYLSSDASAFMTGSVLVIDGGYTVF